MHRIELGFFARNQSVIRFLVVWGIFWSLSMTAVLSFPYFVDFFGLPAQESLIVDFAFVTMFIAVGMWTAASFVGAVVADKARRSRAAQNPVRRLS